MHTILNEEPPYGVVSFDYCQWQSGMLDRLRQWHSQVQQEELRTSNLGQSNIAPPEVLKLSYRRAVVALYRPSFKIPCPTAEAMQELADSAVCVVNLYGRFYRENKLRLFWQAVMNLFSAATALMYCYVHSIHVRNKISSRSLESLIHSSANILWGMVERFPAFKSKRDAFDVIASRFLADLSKHDDKENTIAETSHPISLTMNPTPGESFYGLNFQDDAMEGLALNYAIDITNHEIVPPENSGPFLSSGRYGLDMVQTGSAPHQTASHMSQGISRVGPRMSLPVQMNYDMSDIYNPEEVPPAAWQDFDVATLSSMATWDLET
jgi:hypothetical protein